MLRKNESIVSNISNRILNIEKAFNVLVVKLERYESSGSVRFLCEETILICYVITQGNKQIHTHTFTRVLDRSIVDWIGLDWIGGMQYVRLRFGRQDRQLRGITLTLRLAEPHRNNTKRSIEDGVGSIKDPSRMAGCSSTTTTTKTEKQIKLKNERTHHPTNQPRVSTPLQR